MKNLMFQPDKALISREILKLYQNNKDSILKGQVNKILRLNQSMEYSILFYSFNNNINEKIENFIK